MNTKNSLASLSFGIIVLGFSMNEAVDISYTKFQGPPIDNNAFNLVEPEKDQLYVGWTKPGEWTKYTINFTQEGTYQLGIMFTSNKNGKISIAVNDKDATGLITLPSTANEKETVPWRNWHHWNYLDNIARIELKKGTKTITMHSVKIGIMNYENEIIGCAYDCPLKIRDLDCPFNEIEHLSFKEKAIWMGGISKEKKESIILHHLICTRDRERQYILNNR